MKAWHRRKTWLALLLLVISSVGLVWFLTPRSIEYGFQDQTPRPARPFECHLVLNNHLARWEGALKIFLSPPPPKRYVHKPGNAFAHPDNPLIMNELSQLCPRVEVRNVSGHDVAVQADCADNGSIPLPSLVGGVVADIRDASGSEMCFYDQQRRSARNSLKELASSIDPETREWVPSRFLSERQPPILHLPPGQVLTYDFAILGDVDSDYPIQPGTYTVHAVFRYRAPPEGKRAAGEMRGIRSEPITVRLTQRHIDEWRAWWEAGFR
jgi:hypothetical protein